MAKKKQKARKTATKTPGAAMSVHLGLNAVDPGHYAGWDGQLAACEFDAKDMAAIARSRHMHPMTLLTESATRAAVLSAIRAAAKKLRSGDFFFLTYSGHGGQMPDVTGEEEDKKDETWCLYDGELIDDELYLELGRFAAGVRVLVLSDSCHSGTVTRALPREGRSKMMPPSIAIRTYDEHKAFYDKIQHAVAAAAANGKTRTDPDAAIAHAHATASPRLTEIATCCKAGVILISGCQDNQTSLDGDHNGAFTEQLLQVWDHGTYRGDYVRFHATIKARMPASQTPNLFMLGPAARFAKQQPFVV